jgi:hypothetical protein
MWARIPHNCRCFDALPQGHPRDLVEAYVLFCVLCMLVQPGGVQESLKPAAVLSMIVYSLGLPVAFLVILVRERDAIRADQVLRMSNSGHSEVSNPNFRTRQRFQELYRCVKMLSHESEVARRMCV